MQVGGDLSLALRGHSARLVEQRMRASIAAEACQSIAWVSDRRPEAGWKAQLAPAPWFAERCPEVAGALQRARQGREGVVFQRTVRRVSLASARVVFSG